MGVFKMKKSHLKFGTPRALCGSKTYKTLADFFAAPENNRCEVCLQLLRARGYDAKALEVKLQRERQTYLALSTGA